MSFMSAIGIEAGSIALMYAIGLIYKLYLKIKNRNSNYQKTNNRHGND